MKKIVIYECGKMTGLNFEQMCSWRNYFKELVEKVAENMGAIVEVINPCNYYRPDIKLHNSELEVMKYDLSRIITSDLVVVNIEGLNTSIGSIIECYEAYKRNIPVLAFGSKEDYDNLHPWVQCCITRLDKNCKECINYIGSFYMI